MEKCFTQLLGNILEGCDTFLRAKKRIFFAGTSCFVSGGEVAELDVPEEPESGGTGSKPVDKVDKVV